MIRTVFLLSILTGLVGCASHKPVLYPNTHSQSVGQAQIDLDIVECEQLAKNAGAKPYEGQGGDLARRTVRGSAVGAASGAVGGAIGGNAGKGAKYGAATGATASLVHSIFRDPKPNSTYRNFVSRCLADRGYDIAGWN